MRRKLTNEEFISRAIKVHGDKFSYESTVYCGSRNKVIITCSVHGDFSQLACDHLNGSGCKSCGVISSAETRRKLDENFISTCIDVHGDTYDYSLVNYVNDQIPVTIYCKRHGSFTQKPYNHKLGHNCPACAKFNYRGDIPGYLYVLEYKDIVKIGITNKEVEARLKQINKSSGFDFKIIDRFLFNEGTEAFNLEKKIKEYLKSNHKNITDNFNGSSECFYGVDIEELLNKIAKERYP